MTTLNLIEIATEVSVVQYLGLFALLSVLFSLFLDFGFHQEWTRIRKLVAQGNIHAWTYADRETLPVFLQSHLIESVLGASIAQFAAGSRRKVVVVPFDVIIRRLLIVMRQAAVLLVYCSFIVVCTLLLMQTPVVPAARI